MSDTERISDEVLFIRYAEGDGNAFRPLVDKYTPRLLRFAEATIGSASTSAPAPAHPECAEALEEALGMLTSLEAEAIRLTFLEEWTTRQIANLQGCSPATVRVRRHQALEKLRTVLAGRPEFTDPDIETEIREGMNRHG